MRALAALVFWWCAQLATAERVLLVPLDSRPAAGQFAQMIGNIAGVDVRMPPYELLGQFLKPGSPEAILAWLEAQDLSEVKAVVASSDMLAYGGLIASRTAETPKALALNRMARLAGLKRKWPKTSLYVFSATMRLAPTATRSTASYRTELARLVEVRERYRISKSATDLVSLERLKARVPGSKLREYDASRARNHAIQIELVKMAGRGEFDYLVVGQDDARPTGPHVPETQRLRQLVTKLNIGGRVYFCEGIDQHSNVLLSRALLRGQGWTPRIRVVYSDELGRRKFANYESKPIEASLSDQIIASGARLMGADGFYDYTLYLNTPARRDESFVKFLTALNEEVDQGFPVSVADINLQHDGTADPVLFENLWKNGRMMKLLSFAGWNTAGNTMGTAIPAANVYLLARRLGVDPLHRELTQREFLLHRFVNDYAYHKFTRPAAYSLIDITRRASREETYGAEFHELEDFVKRDLGKHLATFFDEQFMGRRFFAGTGQFEFCGINGVRIFLPWPRAYEVRLEFKLEARAAATAASGIREERAHTPPTASRRR
ncbi:MAG TPA: DUF4127 family protein [Fimbriimonadaceae bacterium]|nr:DUF4127 family protein [Fimbriimonadaceae bacterium]